MASMTDLLLHELRTRIPSTQPLHESRCLGSEEEGGGGPIGELGLRHATEAWDMNSLWVHSVAVRHFQRNVPKGKASEYPEGSY
jgi:hypothetical protein